MKNKLLIGSVINRFLVGALAPMSLTKNFNIIANGNDAILIKLENNVKRRTFINSE